MSLALSILLLSTLPFILAETYSNSTHRLYERNSVIGPVIWVDFPDPSIIWVPSENLWFAFATNGKGRNIQMATSPDFNTWTVTDDSPLPTVGAWALQSALSVWSPMVIQLNDSSFVMYYSATSSNTTAAHCVGVATSETVRGPYTPRSEAFACHFDQGGAVDPAGHQHPDGNSLYVVYKVDGNIRGQGGSCGNGVAPFHSTPFMLQQVAPDGFTKIGDEIQILDRDDGDGPLIAGPSLINVAGTFFLFFSSGCSDATSYDLRYATATSVTGPYVKARAPIAPLLSTGKDDLKAPGSACVTKDGSKMVFDAWLGDTVDSSGRGMWTATLSFSGRTVTLLNIDLPPSESSTSVPSTAIPSSSGTIPHISTLSSISISAPSETLTGSPTKPQTGATAGVVVGGVIALLLLAVALFLLWRRHRRAQAELNRITPNPFPVMSQSPGRNGASYRERLRTTPPTLISVKGRRAVPSLRFQGLQRQVQELAGEFEELRPPTYHSLDGSVGRS